MKIDGEQLQSIWYEPETDEICIVDQTMLPHQIKILSLQSLEDACEAISSMRVRGAPLIGVTAAYGIYLALRDDSKNLNSAVNALANTRPTAVNLRWVLQRTQEYLHGLDFNALPGKALEIAQLMEKEDIAVCEAIREHRLGILQENWREIRQTKKR